MHPEAARFAKRFSGEPGHVVEIGSRNINGSVRLFFADAASYTGIDIAPGPGVDIVANGATFVPGGGVSTPDLVMCLETLEHTDEARSIVQNVASMLRPGGRFLITCATDPRTPHSGIDGGPLQHGEFYRNVAPADLRSWITSAGLEPVLEEFHTDRGDLYALARKA